MDFEYTVDFEVYDPGAFSSSYKLVSIITNAPNSGAAVLNVMGSLRDQLEPGMTYKFRNSNVSACEDERIRLWCEVLNIEASRKQGQS